MGQGPVGVGHAPGEQLLGVAEHQRGIRRVLGQVGGLAGIALQVEEQRRQPGEVHVLVALVAQHVQRALIRRQAKHLVARRTAEVELPVRRLAPAPRRLAGQERRPGLSTSHWRGTGAPIASSIVGMMSTFSVKRPTRAPRAAPGRGSRTISGMWNEAVEIAALAHQPVVAELLAGGRR